MAGDQLANVAFLWLITSLTGSAATLGIVMTALMLPNIAFRLVGGIITDRFHKKLVLIVPDLLRSATILLLALLVLGAHVNMGLFLLVAVCLGIGAALFTPAYNATVPLLVGQDRLLRFNSALQAGNQGIGIPVPALAGLITAAIGVINFADALVVIYPVHLKETLGAGVIWYGVTNASVMTGLFAINLLYVWKGKHIRLGCAFFMSALIEGLGVLVFGLSRS